MSDHIQIRLFSTLKRFYPDPKKPYPITPGMSVKDILNRLKVPFDDIKLVFINGKKADFQTTLKGGERVGIFPPIGGG